jgi:hypothetical protein
MQAGTSATPLQDLQLQQATEALTDDQLTAALVKTGKLRDSIPEREHTQRQALAAVRSAIQHLSAELLVHNGGTLPPNAELRQLQEREASLVKAINDLKEEAERIKQLVAAFHQTQYDRATALEGAATKALQTKYKGSAAKAIQAARDAFVEAVICHQHDYTSDPLNVQIPVFLEEVLNSGEIVHLLIQRVERERAEARAEIQKRNQRKAA